MNLNFTLVLTIISSILIGVYGPKYLGPPKPKFIGIDLGTTFSCVGSYQAGSGDVYVIPDEEGNLCIPSVVSFSESKGILVGYEALGQQNSENTIYDSKRIIGRKMTSEDLYKESVNYPFKVALDESGMAYYIITHSSREFKVTPTDVASHILNRLKNMAQIKLRKNITQTVISFPADFNVNQKIETLKAAKIAGLRVLGVLSEPTSASMAYGMHETTNVSYLIVVDFGGGTFDVSLLFLSGGMFSTIAMAGDNHLGGQDVNSLLFAHFQNVHDFLNLSGSETVGMNEAIEAVKISLSIYESVTYTLTINGTLISGVLTRKTFDELIRPLYARILRPIEVLLEEADKTVSEIDQVVLVGGSTRIPVVRKLLEDYFKFPPNVSVEPEIAVVLGVAMQAGIIGGMWPVMVSVVENPRNISKIRV